MRHPGLGLKTGGVPTLRTSLRTPQPSELHPQGQYLRHHKKRCLCRIVPELGVEFRTSCYFGTAIFSNTILS